MFYETLDVSAPTTDELQQLHVHMEAEPPFILGAAVVVDAEEAEEVEAAEEAEETTEAERSFDAVSLREIERPRVADELWDLNSAKKQMKKPY